MQTIQLLPERAGFLAAARAPPASPGGLLAIAITAALEDFGELDGSCPRPTRGAVADWRFASPADRGARARRRRRGSSACRPHGRARRRA